jgi:hypothetical protein
MVQAYNGETINILLRKQMVFVVGCSLPGSGAI